MKPMASALVSRIVGLAQAIAVLTPEAEKGVRKRRQRVSASRIAATVLAGRGTDAIETPFHGGPAAVWAALVQSESGVEIGDEGIDRIAEAFASVIDAKSPFTHDHSRRVSTLAVAIGTRLGVHGDALIRLRRAALLHDIGKLGIPNHILDKPGRLTSAEWTIVRKHPEFTYEILNRVPIFRGFAFDASCHHEKLDGTGYFRQLTGASISLTARILAVADIVDALLAARPYRAALPPAQVVDILRGDRGRALSADCVDAATDVLNPSRMP
jgi:HD-GYP domain-containing protein (c-di-GMP phosphodiesterase class II)